MDEAAKVSVTGGRRVTLAAVLALSVVGVPAAGLAAPAAADAAGDTTLSGSPSAYVAGLGERVVVRGRVTADEARSVRLQRMVGRSWRTVDSASTTGDFTLTLPTDDAGVGYYRLQAPATGGREGATTATFSVALGGGDARAYNFLTKPPVRWNPCRTVGYRVNLKGAPEDALDDVKQAVTMAAAATGLKFKYQGTTKVVPGATSTSVPDAYPDDTQLVVAWTPPSSTRLLDNRAGVLGVGGVYYDLTPQKVGKNTWYQAVQGYVVLNTDKDLPSGFGPGRSVGELGTWGQVLMHEVGHTLGLDHPAIADKTQIMYPETTYKEAVWGRGDLVALRRVGASSGCFPAPQGPAAPGPQTPMHAGYAR